MKTYTVSFIALSFFFFSSSCSEENDSPTNSSSSNGTSWSFEIELAGKTHRAKGVYPDDNPLQPIIYKNLCLGSQGSGNYTVQFRLNDKTASTYISGEPLEFILVVSAGELGNNNKGSIDLITLFAPTSAYTYMSDFARQKGIIYWGGFVADSSCSYPNGFNVSNQISGIKLTELGSPPSYSNGTLIPTYSQIKGEYQGTLYFAGKCNPTNPDEISYCIPVPISIKFTAVRGS